MQSTKQSKIIQITTNRKIEERVNLTSKVVFNARSRVKRYDIKDDVVKGLRLRIAPTGSKRFIALGRVRRSNKVRTLTIGDANLITVDDARKFATDYLSKLQMGIDANEQPHEKSLTTITLNDAMRKYLNDRDLRPKTIASYEYEIPKYCSQFLNKSIVEISEDDICKWYLANKHIPTSIDKAFRSLRAILEYMVGTRIIDRNPCTAITARKLRYKIKARTKRIENYNLTKFLDSWLVLLNEGELSTVQGDFILWLLMTGCRLDEARTLKWTNVDNDKLVITINDTKNGLPHTVPITPLISDMLYRRWQDNPDDNPYIFPAKRGRGYSDIKHLSDCRKSLDKITTRANIPPVRPHDLRRSFTTILDDLNISESNIKALLNHNDGTVTRKHYLQATNTEVKRKNLWAVGLHLEKAVTVKGVNPNTNEDCIFACAGAIRKFIYKTSECDFSEIKEKQSAQTILDGMR